MDRFEADYVVERNVTIHFYDAANQELLAPHDQNNRCCRLPTCLPLGVFSSARMQCSLTCLVSVGNAVVRGCLVTVAPLRPSDLADIPLSTRCVS